MRLRICMWNCTPLHSLLFYFSFFISSFLRNYSYVAGGIFNTGRNDFILCECLCEISGVSEAFALVGCYVAYVGSWLPTFNPLNAELYPIYHLLALLRAHHILHVGRIRVNYENVGTTVCPNTFHRSNNYMD